MIPSYYMTKEVREGSNMVFGAGSLVRWNMAGLQVRFPILVGETIPPFPNGLCSASSVKSSNNRSCEPNLKLDGCPHVEVDGFNLADMCPHGPVNTRASDAQKHATGERILDRCHSRRQQNSQIP